MLFRKKHPRACTYCSYGTQVGEGQILCIKRGIQSEESACRRFSYDPCKRIPPKSKGPDFLKYQEEDFSL